tara:strand:+ start:2559 stop:2816 length:258 start_codon:yes stop_codon:yes gene_type:complete
MKLTTTQTDTLRDLRSQYLESVKHPTAYSPWMGSGYGVRESTLRALAARGLATVVLHQSGFCYIWAGADAAEVSMAVEAKAAYWA